MWHFFLVPLPWLVARYLKVVGATSPLNLKFSFSLKAWMTCCLHPTLRVTVPMFPVLAKCQPRLKMLLILLRLQRTPRSEARPDLIHIFETLFCLSKKVKKDKRKCDLLFIISTISSAKHDFSLLITLSMKIKCFPKDLALTVMRKSGDLFKTPMNSESKRFQFF